MVYHAEYCHREGANVTMRKVCPNKGFDHKTPPGYYYGTGRPEMTRLYIRTSEQVSKNDPDRPWAKTQKRSWVAIGWVCVECHTTTFDSDAEAAA